MHPIRTVRGAAAAALLMAGLSNWAGAQGPPATLLAVGDEAPDFTIPGSLPIPTGGSTVSIRSITDQGKSVVLAFFPKAFTGG